MQPKYNVATTLEQKRRENLHIHHCDNQTATFECNLNITVQQRLKKTRRENFRIHHCDNRTATFECNLNTTLQQRWKKKPSGKLSYTSL